MAMRTGPSVVGAATTPTITISSPKIMRRRRLWANASKGLLASSAVGPAGIPRAYARRTGTTRNGTMMTAITAGPRPPSTYAMAAAGTQVSRKKRAIVRRGDMLGAHYHPGLLVKTVSHSRLFFHHRMTDLVASAATGSRHTPRRIPALPAAAAAHSVPVATVRVVADAASNVPTVASTTPARLPPRVVLHLVAAPTLDPVRLTSGPSRDSGRPTSMDRSTDRLREASHLGTRRQPLSERRTRPSGFRSGYTASEEFRATRSFSRHRRRDSATHLHPTPNRIQL